MKIIVNINQDISTISLPYSMGATTYKYKHLEHTKLRTLVRFMLYLLYTCTPFTYS